MSLPPGSGPSLGVDLLGVVARLNRLATQRTQMPLPRAQARLLSTIDDRGEARTVLIRITPADPDGRRRRPAKAARGHLATARP